MSEHTPPPQPPSGQPPSGQPSSGQPSSGQPSSGQPSSAEGQPPSAQGQPQAQTAAGYPYPYPYAYAQQGYGQQPYGQQGGYQRPPAAGQAQRTACAGILLAGLFMVLGLMCLLPSLFSAANQNMVSAQTTGANLSEVRVAGDAAASEKIAMIEVSGVIADVQVSGGLLGGAVDLVGRLRGEFNQAAKDDAVKGVLLRIDSPGGTVGASDRIWHLVSEFKRTTGKPVVVHMGGTCASGGYYIAVACDHLIAEPTTITGSIGVVLSTLNFADLLKEYGVKDVTIKSGANKDLLNSTAPPREEHLAIMQAMVDETHARFTEIVAKGRPIALEKVRQLADGRIYTANQALKHQLIDEIGYQEQAFATARRLAQAGACKLIRYRKPPTFADVLAGTARAPQLNVDDLLGRLQGPRLLVLWRGR